MAAVQLLAAQALAGQVLAADGGSCTSCGVSTSARWWLIVPVIAVSFVLAGVRWWSGRRHGGEAADPAEGARHEVGDDHDGQEVTPPRAASPGRPSGSGDGS